MQIAVRINDKLPLSIAENIGPETKTNRIIWFRCFVVKSLSPLLQIK